MKATLAVVGTVIGAGVFALPVAMKQVGILAGSVVYWIAALVVLCIHLMYADVMIRRPSLRKRRLPGQVRELAGKFAGAVAAVSHPLQILGACLAYLILGGEFLSQLATYFGLSVSVLAWQIIFWASFGAIVFMGLKFMAKIEAALTWALVALMLVAIGFFIRLTDGSLVFQADWLKSFAPIGIFLFALVGLPVIPEVAEMCAYDERRTKLSIGLGTLAAAFLMWLFAIFGYAALGPGLGSHLDLARALPVWLFWLLPAVGFLAVATSFVTLEFDLKNMLVYDAKLPRSVAWALALGTPLVMLLTITSDFLQTVEFSGAIFSSLNGLLISVLAIEVARRAGKKGFCRRSLLPCVTASVFLAVLVWRILYVLI